LFFALSGVAVAAKPLLTGADIQDNTIASADIKDGDIQAVDVKSNSLTGAVIDESTLTLPAPAGSVAHHWVWALQSPNDPTEGAALHAGDWTLTPTCDSASLRLAISGPSGYTKTLELTSGSFVSETALSKILPDFQETTNGVTLPSALDIHGSYGRTAITGFLGCVLIVVATPASEG
jgi:hypothetical protein